MKKKSYKIQMMDILNTIMLASVIFLKEYIAHSHTNVVVHDLWE